MHLGEAVAGENAWICSTIRVALTEPLFAAGQPAPLYFENRRGHSLCLVADINGLGLTKVSPATVFPLVAQRIGDRQGVPLLRVARQYAQVRGAAPLRHLPVRVGRPGRRRGRAAFRADWSVAKYALSR